MELAGWNMTQDNPDESRDTQARAFMVPRHTQDNLL